MVGLGINMNFSKAMGCCLLALLAWSLCATPAKAQPERLRPGGDPPPPAGQERRPGESKKRGRNPVYEAMLRIHYDLPYRDIFSLMRHEPLRKALEIEELPKIENSGRRMFSAVREIVEELQGGQKQTTEQIQETLLAALKPIEDEAVQVFVDEYGEEKLERLIELYVQSRGTAAAANKLVAERIGLSGEELDGFRHELERIRRDRQHHDAVRKIIENPSIDDVRERIAEVMRKWEEKTNSRLMKELTSEQREALKDLEGEPFDNLPKPSMRFGGFRPTGGERGPPRGTPENGPPPPRDRERPGRPEPARCH